MICQAIDALSLQQQQPMLVVVHLLHTISMCQITPMVYMSAVAEAAFPGVGIQELLLGRLRKVPQA